MLINRTIQSEISDNLFKNKVIIVYGARRTGKTILVKNILEQYGEEGRYLNCDDMQVQSSINNENIDSLLSFLGNYKLIVLDEAQNIPRIGHILKLLVDTKPEIQIIATGSSSFELANQTGEPLVGRARTYELYPLSIAEISPKHDSLLIKTKLESLLRFGSMPSVYGNNESEMMAELNQISNNYLYKDILMFEGIKKSTVIQNILKALALQLGSEISYREIGELVGVNNATVSRYIDILTKCNIVFELTSLSRNPRNEIKRGKKIYFYDLGIRNSIIQNYNKLDSRTDFGALWENFCILEKLKKSQRERIFSNQYFWRTVGQQEIDYIEEYAGILHAFEFKFSPKKTPKIPTNFALSYPEHTFERSEERRVGKEC